MHHAATPFWLDTERDQRNADLGTSSRYMNYVDQRLDWFDLDHDDPRASVAVAAWRIARGPIMSPPYVCSHRRILEAQLIRSEWNGRLVATADLVSHRPPALDGLRDAQGFRARDWHLDEMADAFHGPGGRDLEQRWYITTTVNVAAELPDSLFDSLPPLSRNVAATAHAYLPHLVAAMNTWLGPVINSLEGH